MCVWGGREGVGDGEGECGGVSVCWGRGVKRVCVGGGGVCVCVWGECVGVGGKGG